MYIKKCKELLDSETWPTMLLWRLIFTIEYFKTEWIINDNFTMDGK